MTYKIPKNKALISAIVLDRLISYAMELQDACRHSTDPNFKRQISSNITRANHVLFEHNERKDN